MDATDPMSRGNIDPPDPRRNLSGMKSMNANAPNPGHATTDRTRRQHSNRRPAKNLAPNRFECEVVGASLPPGLALVVKSTYVRCGKR